MTQIKSNELSQLDFDQIKNNLKQFLSDQTTFADYDFEGSGLSLLLDVLAYNTHYNAYIGNMFANEMFLDSAVKRSSAVSIAKQLGFTPASIRSARANLNLTVNEIAAGTTSITLDAKTPFSTSIGGNAFTFFNLESSTIKSTAGEFTLTGLEVVEGTLRNLSFVVANPGPDEKYIIPDLDIDTSTLKVTVQGSTSNTSSDSYNLTTDTTNVTSISRVFFLEMTPEEKYEIFFGDGLLGHKLISGNLVNIEYLKSSGSLSNSSDKADIKFTTTTIGGSSNVNPIITQDNPNSGASEDSLTSIKFKAPRANAARNRAVTASDYKSLIESNFTEAESIIVYGGEDNVPPKFGKVIISLKPFDGFNISQSTKDSIASSVLNTKKVMSVQPEFIDPEFNFINLVVNVSFNSLSSTLSSEEIKTLVTNTIDNYFSNDLQKFDKNFIKSKLISNILSADTSIISVIILVNLQKRKSLNLGSINTFNGDDSITFNNSLQPGTVKTSRFFQLVDNTTTLVNMTDVPNSSPADLNGSGSIVIKNISNDAIVNSSAGSVDYLTGEVILNEFTPTALPNNLTDFNITSAIQESSQNIVANRNNILIRDKSALNAAAGVDTGLTVNVTAIEL